MLERSCRAGDPAHPKSRAPLFGVEKWPMKTVFELNVPNAVPASLAKLQWD